jgi:signal transduction histidine kinase
MENHPMMESKDPSEMLPLEALYEVSLQVSAELEIDKLLHLIVEQATRLLKGCAGGFHRYDPIRDVLIWSVAHGDYASPLGTALRKGEGIAGRVLETGQAMTLNPDELLSPESNDETGRGAERGVVAVPVVHGKELLGVLHVLIEPPRDFTADDVRLLSLFANQAAVAIRNARLVQALQDSQIQLRRYAQELRARNEELDAFAHTVAHDLKSPLANLLMFVQILEEGYASITQEEAEIGVQALGRNARKAINIVEELLLLSSVRKEDVTRSALNMRAIVEESCRRLQDMTERYDGHIEIVGEQWPTAMGYAPWVEEVWINYLSNALKYGGSHPHITIGAERSFPALFQT